MSGASLSKQQTADTVMAHRRWSAMLLKAKPNYYSGVFSTALWVATRQQQSTADQQTDKQIFPPLLIDTDQQHCQKWNWIFTNLTRGFLSHYNVAPSTINELIFNTCYETIAVHLISNAEIKLLNEINFLHSGHSLPLYKWLQHCVNSNAIVNENHWSLNFLLAYCCRSCHDITSDEQCWQTQTQYHKLWLLSTLQYYVNNCANLSVW